MDFLFWLRIAVLLAGSSLAAYGFYVLITGRLSDRSRASFRSIRDAGMYPICSGMSLVLLALGQFVSHADTTLSFVLSLSATVLALIFMGFAVVRYRPRKLNSRP